MDSSHLKILAKFLQKDVQENLKIKALNEVLGNFFFFVSSIMPMFCKKLFLLIICFLHGKRVNR